GFVRRDKTERSMLRYSRLDGDGKNGELLAVPTRRSSDLRGRRHGRIRRADEGPALGRRDGRVQPPARRPHAGPHDRQGPGRDLRSEEHTSELQALRHLVCRLLLEKKKRREEHTTELHSLT